MSNEPPLAVFYDSFKFVEDEHPNYYKDLVKYFNDKYLNINIEKQDSEELEDLSFRKLILSRDEGDRNYFTITSSTSFNFLPTMQTNFDWGQSLIYHPLNDHSRGLLKKGDVLFCYRQGQFVNLNEALKMRGIYGVGIAASDPIELFPDETKHKKWGVLVCFPIQLPRHLELKNIQMHPDTINLTPYNGNRNDSLQYIPELKHYKTLLNMLYSMNDEMSQLLKFYFPEFHLDLIDLPSKILDKHYSPDNKKSEGNNNFIQEKFVEWFFQKSNYKKSYNGLVSVDILNFWNNTYFKNSLFIIDINDIEGSIKRLCTLVRNPLNLDWINYSQATSKGAPAALLGEHNYIKFIRDLFENDENVQKYTALIGDISSKSSTFFAIQDFINALKTAKIHTPKTLPPKFTASLQTKPFTILTGLSGSGKTKLAEAFSLWISETNSQYCMVSVGADWTNREPLLGFPNALEEGKYVKPDSGALELIIRAEKDQTMPYFLILDEMNMSHVERYFADFLSAMESTDRIISLHPDTDAWKGCDVPASIKLPQNLFIIGTVNIDETTYMFSPKVLDRANVIEFRVEEDEMKSYLTEPTELEMNSLRGAGASMGESFVARAKEKGLISENLETHLMPFFKKLKEAGAEFGYRTASEISRFVAICTDLASNQMDENEVIDAAIMQKLLPKVHGSRNKIEKILKELGKLCLENLNNEPFQLNDDKNDKFPVKYPISYEKLKRMHKRVIADGFTSFAEA